MRNSDDPFLSWGDKPYNFRETYERAKNQAPVRLPEPQSYAEFENSPVEKPRLVVAALLDSSSRMVFGGGSKTFKTWAMSDLALSIAAGVPWLIFRCVQSQVLYVNFELKPYYARERFKAIRLAKGIPKPPEALAIWNLRDQNIARQLGTFRDQTIEFIKDNGIAVLFLDPFYKLLGDHDERLSSELIPVLNVFEDISRQSDTSIITACHYTKGNQAAKEPLDRVSGGGALNRHPDSLIMLTKHKQEGAFVIDTITRDFPPLEPFVVRWEYPLLCIDKELSPEDLKIPGRPKRYEENDILKVLKTHDDQLSTTELFKRVHEKTNMSNGAFYSLWKQIRESDQVFESKLSGKWNLR
jgi:hypothetical protein